MLRTFIQVMSLSLVLISSFFLIKGVVSLSVKNIAELSRAKFDYHSGIVKNLTRQKADTTVGFVLLLASFALSLINLLWPMRVGDFGVSKLGVIIALAVSITIFFVAYRLSCYLQQKWYIQAENILKKPKNEQYLKGIAMNWKRGFRRITLVLAIVVASLGAVIFWEVLETRYVARQHLRNCERQLYDIERRIESGEESNRLAGLDIKLEVDKAKANFWATVPLWGAVAIAIFAGLSVAAAGFCAVWLIYYLIEWLILGFCADKPKDEQKE